MAGASLLVLSGAIGRPAGAHEGQPYPILRQVEAGPYRIDLWADPDFGEGEFWVVAQGSSDPAALEVRLSAEPERGRREPLVGLANWQPTRNRPESPRYVALLPLDRDGWWQMQIDIDGPPGHGHAEARFEVISLGPSRREALSYLIPFALILLLAVGHQLRRRPDPGRA